MLHKAWFVWYEHITVQCAALVDSVQKNLIDRVQNAWTQKYQILEANLTLT